MRLNAADRNFALVVGVGIAPYAVLFAAGCGLATYLVQRVSDDGLGEAVVGWLLPVTGVLVLLAAGAAGSAWSVLRQVRATHRLREHVAAASVDAPTHAPPTVHVVDDDDPFAFTYGLGAPQIVVSRGLVDELSAGELEAVLAHEQYHVRARDPLKLVVARAAARASFFLPAVRPLVRRYLAGRELAADRLALRRGDRTELAGALVKVAAGPRWDELEAAAAMADPELLAVRVDQIEHGREPALPAVPVAAVLSSAVVLGLVVALFSTVGLQGGLGMMTGTASPNPSTGDVLTAAVGGLACAAGWTWFASVAFRRLTPSP